MTLGIFLAMGDSFGDMKKSGQDTRFKSQYLGRYAKNFKRIYIFTYQNENVADLPNNIQVIPNRLSLPRYIYGIVMPFLSLRKITECDVIRAFHLSGTIPAIISKIFLSKPFVFNYGYDYSKFAKVEKRLPQMILFFLIRPISILLANKIFTPSEELFRNLPKRKTIYLPNGVNIDVFKPFMEKKNSSRINILSVGRLERQKNFKSLILALANSSYKLTLVGNGSEKEKLKKAARDNKVDLKLIDKVENSKLPVTYNKADLFVLPSRVEGSSKVLLEAMSCGLPVIATNVEGTRDILKNNINGILVEPKDTLSKVIIRLLNNKDKLKSISKNARSTIVKYFNLDNLMNQEILEIKSLNG